MVREFSVSTNSTGAEYGNTSGGVVNIASKSGTNAFHFTAYEFVRNKVLNANLFFNKQVGAPRSAFTQNQYGATAGGPIKRDKAFFFFSWEGFALRQGNRLITSVPTDAERAGNFSAAGLNPIYDPCAGSLSSQGLCASVPAARTRFAGNVIPTTRLNPVALNLLRLWPHANIATATPVNNFTRNYSTGINYNQFNVRGDYNLTKANQLFVRYGDWRSQRLPTDSLGTGTGSQVSFQSKQAVVGDTLTINPTTIVDMHIAFTRFYTKTLPQAAGLDQTTIGLPASYNTETNRGYLSPCVTGLFTQFCSTNLALTIGGANNNFEIVTAVTKLLGKHSLKAGLVLRTMQFNFGQVNYGSGFFNFDPSFSSNLSGTTSVTGTGDSFASYLLGYTSRTGSGAVSGIQQGKKTAGVQHYQGYYVTDTWQVSPRLTANLGVRWEIPTFWRERHDSLDVLLPKNASPLQSFVDPITGQNVPIMGQAAVVNSAAYGNHYQMETHYGLFAPRMGISFRATPSVVIRAGYGMFYLPSGISFLSAPSNSSVNTAVTNPPFATGTVPVTTLSNPLPNGFNQPAGHSQAGVDALYGQSYNGVVPNQSYPYNQQWNLAVQQGLGGSASLEIAYAGASGVDLPNSVSANQIAPGYLATAAAQVAGGQAATLSRAVANPFFGRYTAAAATTTYGQLLLPFPQYVNVTNGQNNAYHSNYQALQSKLEKRFKSNASILISYTWSKFISNTDTQATYLESNGFSNNGGVFQYAQNPRGERSVSAGNIPQLLVSSFNLDLPVGRGRHFLNNLNPAVDKVIGGWGINGITSYQSGFPLTFTSASVPTALSSLNITTLRPDVSAGCIKGVNGSSFTKVTSGAWFNKSCFAAPAAYTLGNEPRVDPTLKQGGFKNWDLAFFKKTEIRDSLNVEFRAEFFNLFNTTRFGAPNASFGSAAFGTVTAQGNQPRLLQFGLRVAY